MEVALPLDFQLYLEGVPVDFESITITSQVGVPSVANISIPPTVLSQKILPRTSVHVFYMEPTEVYSSDAPEELIGKPVFKLLFEGEVMAISYNKSTNSRSTVLICSDITNNFDYAYRYTIEDVAPLSGSPCEEAISGTKATVGLTNSPTIGGPIARFITGKDTISEGVSDLIALTYPLKIVFKSGKYPSLISTAEPTANSSIIFLLLFAKMLGNSIVAVSVNVSQLLRIVTLVT